METYGASCIMKYIVDQTNNLCSVRWIFLHRRNVYYHPLETGTMRDIFRQPFNNCLLSCVASTYFAILVAMGLIIYAAKTVLHNEEAKRVGIGEAALWCISIMCMQGYIPWISSKEQSGISKKSNLSMFS